MVQRKSWTRLHSSNTYIKHTQFTQTYTYRPTVTKSKIKSRSFLSREPIGWKSHPNTIHYKLILRKKLEIRVQTAASGWMGAGRLLVRMMDDASAAAASWTFISITGTSAVLNQSIGDHCLYRANYLTTTVSDRSPLRPIAQFLAIRPTKSWSSERFVHCTVWTQCCCER